MVDISIPVAARIISEQDSAAMCHASMERERNAWNCIEWQETTRYYYGEARRALCRRINADPRDRDPTSTY